MPDPYGPWKYKKRIRTKSLIPRNKTEQISLQVMPSMREDLVALSYLRGEQGMYAPVTRQLLERAIRDYIVNDLTDDERKEFEGIKENVKNELMVSRMRRQERKKNERREAAIMLHDREDVIPEYDEEDD